MRRFDFPTAPVISGAVLGPAAETECRRAMTIQKGDWTVFSTEPLSAALLPVAAVAPVGPRLYAFVHGCWPPSPTGLPGEA